MRCFFLTDMECADVPLLTPSSKEMMSQALKATFSGFSKEQQRLGIPKGTWERGWGQQALREVCLPTCSLRSAAARSSRAWRSLLEPSPTCTDLSTSRIPCCHLDHRVLFLNLFAHSMRDLQGKKKSPQPLGAVPQIHGITVAGNTSLQ